MATENQNDKERLAGELVRPLSESVYQALRRYQCGTLRKTYVVVGQLSEELTALYECLLELMERPNEKMSRRES